MKIALIGGTGDMGRALALHWARRHQIYLGSRDLAKARKVAALYLQEARRRHAKAMKGAIKGLTNEAAASRAEVVVLTIPYEGGLEYVGSLKSSLREGALVVCPVAPLKKEGNLYVYHAVQEGRKGGLHSFAEVVAQRLPKARVVAALQAVPARRLARSKESFDSDVPIASDHRDAASLASQLVAEIPGLRPLYIGPLKAAALIEPLTSLLLNLHLYSGLKEPTIHFV